MHLLNRGVLASLLFSCTLAMVARASESPVVATVGNTTITLEDFNKRYDEVKKQAVNPPTKKAFLEDLIRYEMGVQEAQRHNLEKDPIVAERMRQELYKGLVEKELSEKINSISISDSEMREYYRNNPEIRTSHILIEVKPNATAAERDIAKKRAQEIYSEVKKSKRPFQDLVKLYSDDVATNFKNCGKSCGDVGYQTKLTVYPTYYDAAKKLKMGQVSNVVETPYGFHIIKLTGIHSYPDANKRQIRAAIFDQKRLAIFNSYFDKIKHHYRVTVNQDVLK